MDVSLAASSHQSLTLLAFLTRSQKKAGEGTEAPATEEAPAAEEAPAEAPAEESAE